MHFKVKLHRCNSAGIAYIPVIIQLSHTMFRFHFIKVNQRSLKTLSITQIQYAAQLHLHEIERNVNIRDSLQTSHAIFKTYFSPHLRNQFFLFFSLQIEQLRKSNKFEDEIRMEQEERKREEEEKAARREQFRQRAAIFGKN